MEKEEIFSRVVENAFDFLDRSLEEFDKKRYKYSVINFCAAVELFLKARLIREHWTLILSKNAEPSIDIFLSGQSQSATLGEIKRRLDLVLKDGLSKSAADAFGSLSKHRNQVIHFCHPRLSKQSIPQIVGEQFRAWYYMQELLTTQWRKYFEEYGGEISGIDAKIKKNREYLGEKFKILEKQIKADISKNIYYHKCPVCGFESLRFLGETPHLFRAECLVCNFNTNAAIIDCPHCSEKVTFLGEGFAVCQCGQKLYSKDLYEVMFDKVEAYSDFKDGGDSFREGNCCECDSYHSVIPYYGSYVCLNCLTIFDLVYRCEYCNELQTDPIEDSFFCGCGWCDGRLGKIENE